MQTTTTGSCQIELFAGLSAHRRKGSRILPTPCPVCGGVFKPNNGRKYCSHKCAVIQIGRQKKGKTIDPDLIAWHKCATCHAIMGMPGKMSGDLLRKDRSTICTFRKENALPTLSKSQATKSTSIRMGKAQRYAEEQWWQENWEGVVDTYWDKCSNLIIAKMKNPEIPLSSLPYHMNLDRNRKIVRDRARQKYNELKSNKDNAYWVKHKLKNGIKRIYRKIAGKKQLRTIEHLGCTVLEAKHHIEMQFKEGMTWDNHGVVWEIDHIIPLAAFDLTRKDQQMIANHYTNLRPLWKALNRLKADKIVVTHQLSFA